MKLCNFVNLVIIRIVVVSCHFEYELRNLPKSFENLIFSNYEKCLIKLDSIDGRYSYLDQTQCKGLSNGNIYDSYIFPQKSISVSKISRSLFSACSMGFGLDNKGDLSGQSAAKMTGSGLCAVRKLNARLSLDKCWKLLNSSQPLSVNLLQDMFRILKLKRVRNVVLFGDSITRQISRFISCDLLRTPDITVLSNSSLFYSTLEGETKFSEFEFDGHYLKIMLGEDNDTLCGTNKLPFAKYMLNSFRCQVRGATTRSPYVFIYNAGLHLYSGVKMFNKYIQPIIKAFLKFAKENRGRVYVFFRETSAQHFNARIGGQFDGDINPTFKEGDLCCKQSENMTVAYEGDWRNRIFKETFYKEDPDWESYVGWIPFYDTTLALYDMHMEINKKEDADCTHFVYSPFIFNPLWMDTIQAMRKMLLK